jgi:hypothetical protein
VSHGVPARRPDPVGPGRRLAAEWVTFATARKAACECDALPERAGCLVVPQDSMPTLESRLRQMASEEQRRTATELASVVLPLAELGSLGLPAGGLGPIADAIRARTSIPSVDAARHALLSMPEMSRDEEPEDLASWFAFGALVAWVYAADANTTSASDGVVHTFNRVSELLDEIDNDLGDTQLLNKLLLVMNGLGGTTESWATLSQGVREAVDRLRSR